MTARGIEVGHIFYFGDKYSRPMGAFVAGPDGEAVALEMGSYGIGVSRLVGALIEANHDDAGIIWPPSVAPFRVGLINLRPADTRCREAADELYSKLLAGRGRGALRRPRRIPGRQIRDNGSDRLAGAARRSARAGIAAGTVEIKHRRSGGRRDLSVEAALDQLNAPHPGPLPAGGAKEKQSPSPRFSGEREGPA